MRPRSARWHDEQYDNRARIAEHPAILAQWSGRSEAARDRLDARLDVPYGNDASERLDVFVPSGEGAPVLVYIHGGYWRALDKRDQSFVAAPFVDAGALVVLPNYALCPAVTIEAIALQLVAAVAWVHRHARQYGGDPSRLVVAGHSAGGHLAALLLCCDWRSVGADLPPQVIRAALAVSGVFDLEPLRHAPFLAPDLRLDAASARRLSPAFMPPPHGAALHAVVGAGESEEFQRQTRLIARRWGTAGVPTCETVPDRHHMNVLHDLADPARRVHRLALGLLELAAQEAQPAGLQRSRFGESLREER